MMKILEVHRLYLVGLLVISLVFWFTFITPGEWAVLIGFIRHAHGGIVAGAIVIFLMHYFVHMKLRWHLLLYAVAVLTIGVGVEVIEVYLSDFRGHIINPMEVIQDTILDIYADLVGGYIILSVYYFVRILDKNKKLA